MQLQVFGPARTYGEQGSPSVNLAGDARDGAGPEIAARPLTGWRARVKRAEDLVLASLLLVASSPVLLVAAALVACTSRGPVMLRQSRFGYGDVPFI